MCSELAFQISEQFEALGAGIGVKCGEILSLSSSRNWFPKPMPFASAHLPAVVVGGVDMMTQALMLAKKPHVVIGMATGMKSL